MDNFFQEHLKSFVDTTQKNWRWHGPSGTGPGISAEALQAFQRADAIRKAFFEDGGQNPLVRFQLEPIRLDADATQFVLDLDGQRISCNHGPPPRPNVLQWPGQNSFGQVQIMFDPPLAGRRSGLTTEGPWAWFRILDLAGLKPTRDPESFILTFSVGGRTAIYKLRAGSAYNPFRLKDLAQFRCPQRL